MFLLYLKASTWYDNEFTNRHNCGIETHLNLYKIKNVLWSDLMLYLWKPIHLDLKIYKIMYPRKSTKKCITPTINE